MKKITVLVVLLIIGGVTSSIYFYRNNPKDGDILQNVGKLMVLSDEVPNMATVTDSSKLVDQNFFKNANNGDQILIFQTASKAILYRPKINKIIDVATVSIPEIKITEPVSVKISDKNITAALYNGTNIPGLTNKYETLILEKHPDIIIDSKEKAVRSDFNKTIIIDVSEKNKDLADTLARELQGVISPLPDGETKPNVDLIIIFGKGSLK